MLGCSDAQRQWRARGAVGAYRQLEICGAAVVLGSIIAFEDQNCGNNTLSMSHTVPFARADRNGAAREPRAVRDASNAVWGMQFVWPIRAEYRIVYLAPDYSETIVGRSKRDYVWIMARTPTSSEADYARLAARVGELGYDVAKLERVPQRW